MVSKFCLVLRIAALSAAIPFVAGCSDSPQEQTSRIRIVPEIRTRATALNFEAGDRIGLTVLKGGAPYAENRLLTYDGALFSSPDLTWYEDAGQTATLLACYPYSEAGMPATFAIAPDQRAGCASSDLLGAVRSDVQPDASPIGMVFYHLMTQLTVRVTNESSARIVDLYVGGFVPQADVDFTTLTATPSAGAAPAEVAACCTTEGSAYRVVLVPQQATLAVRIATDDGKEYTKSIPGVTLAGGTRYDLAVTLADDRLALLLNGEISDWIEGGSIVETPDDGSVVCGGVTYPTVVIGGQTWMAENMRYLPADAVVGENVWYPAGGAQAVEEQGMLYDYAFATAGSSTPPVRGICPEGWHVPDAGELAALAASTERGGDFFRCAGFWMVGNASYGSANKGYLLGATCSGEKFDCLVYSESGATPQVVSMACGGFGMSLRCVRD